MHTPIHTTRPRIALIHAVQVAMQPIEEAFREHWPQAEVTHLLEDSLSPDRAQDLLLVPALHSRINMLADYAMFAGAAAILFTCSAFGEAIEAATARLPVPVLKPNEAMFEAALDCGKSIGMLATFAPSVESMEREFQQLAAARGVAARLETVLVSDAMAALKAGDAASHNRLLAEASLRLARCDCIMLAHFSTSRAFSAVQERVASAVLTSPSSAVLKIRRQLASNSKQG